MVREIARYDASLVIEQAETPPSSWYKDASIYNREQEHVFGRNWVAVDVLGDNMHQIGSYQTGTFQQEPYLLTRNAQGQLQAWYNICTHAGSCLVGPWTTPGSQPSSSSSCKRLSSDLVGQSVQGNLVGVDKSPRRHARFVCPYHGWEFNLDGNLVKATHMRGIQGFSPKNYGLTSIPVQLVGDIVFMNFGAASRKRQEQARGGADPLDDTNGNDDKVLHEDLFLTNRLLFASSLEKSGFHGDFSNLTFVATRQYKVQCNWKVFSDNYGGTFSVAAVSAKRCPILYGESHTRVSSVV